MDTVTVDVQELDEAKRIITEAARGVSEAIASTSESISKPEKEEMTTEAALDLVLRLKYLQSFAVYILSLDARYNLLIKLRDECRGKDGKVERAAISRKMRGLSVTISKAGSLWTGMASGRIKPWRDMVDPAIATKKA